MSNATREKGNKVHMPPIPSAEVRRDIMVRELCDGYRRWVRKCRSVGDNTTPRNPRATDSV